ncbi:hypothetical protein [Roseivirga sp.]|uniref:hypothetical protein n=1 Tax=Roseivirga sp. TaxID=1964215 RepID=UPI003B8D45B3
MKYLIRGNDFKARQWAKNAPNSDIHWINGARLLFGFKVIAQSWRLKSKSVIVVQRYLNDYPSYWKSFMLVVTDLVYLSYLKMRGIELWWLCHNIDQESEVNHSKFIRWRRHLALSSAKKILVTDPFFIKYASLLFRKYKVPIDAVCFGDYSNQMDIHASNLKVTKPLSEPLSFKSIGFSDLLKLLKEQRNSSEFIGYCGGGVLPKKKYLESVPELIEKSAEEGITLKLLVLSNLSEKKNPRLYRYLLKSPHVIFINSLMDLDLHAIAPYVDFYWTGYDDISMPFSIHAANTTGVPSISLNVGIIPLLLRHYQIGFTLAKDLSNLKETLLILKRYDFKHMEFLKQHEWNSFEKLLQKNNKIRSNSTNSEGILLDR